MIIFLLFLFVSTFACEIDKEMTIEKILSRNKALPTQPHFEKYIQTLLTKSSLRQKYCGERLNSPACTEKLTMSSWSKNSAIRMAEYRFRRGVFTGCPLSLRK